MSNENILSLDTIDYLLHQLPTIVKVTMTKTETAIDFKDKQRIGDIQNVLKDIREDSLQYTFYVDDENLCYGVRLYIVEF